MRPTIIGPKNSLEELPLQAFKSGVKPLINVSHPQIITFQKFNSFLLKNYNSATNTIKFGPLSPSSALKQLFNLPYPRKTSEFLEKDLPK